MYVRAELELDVRKGPHARDRELAALEYHVGLGGVAPGTRRALGEVHDAIDRRKHRTVD
jgi:hypothetical protein